MNFTLLKLFFIFTLLTNSVQTTLSPTSPKCFHKTQGIITQIIIVLVHQQQVIWSDRIYLRLHLDSHDCFVHHSYPLVEGDPDDDLVSHRSYPVHAYEKDFDIVYGNQDDSLDSFNQHRDSNSPDGHGDALQLDSRDRSSQEILELCNDLQIDLKMELKELMTMLKLNVEAYLNGDANDQWSILDNMGCTVGNYYDASRLRQALATKYGVDVLVMFKNQDGIPCLFEFGFLYDNNFQIMDHSTAADIPEGMFLRSRNRF